MDDEKIERTDLPDGIPPEPEEALKAGAEGAAEEPAEAPEALGEVPEAELAETAGGPDGTETPEEAEAESLPEPGESGEKSAPVEPEETDEAPEETAAEPEEPVMDGIRLGASLCEAVLSDVGKDSFHGGVRPDNISVGDQSAALGGRLVHGVGEFTPQELEYMAPELFWDGIRSPAADVYSIGLVLYSVYNGGRMPFWPEQGEATPNVRASSLQKRMNDEPITPPAQAGKELSAIILRALAFPVEERWHDVQELRAALLDCTEEQPKGADIAAAVAGLMARGAEPLQGAREPEKIESPFVEDYNAAAPEEAPIPPKKARKRKPRRRRRVGQIIAWIVLLLAIAALIFLLRQCGQLETETNRPSTTPVVVSENTDSDGVKIINGNQVDTSVTPTPEPTPEPTPSPEPAPAVASVEYTAYREDVSWSEAVARCEAMGGELAMPANYAEFLEITQACEDVGISCAWLGAHRDENGSWVNMSGEPATFFAWGEGEPSVQDNDGTAEDYFLLWNLIGGRWSGNDMRENPVAEFPAYSGIIGYVCKTVTYEGEEAAVTETTETAETVETVNNG